MKRNTSHNIFSPQACHCLPLLLLAGCVSQPQSCSNARLPTRHPAPPSPATFSRSLRTSMRGRRKWCATIVICWSVPIRRRPSVTLSQIIDIRIPSSLHPTVADALRYAPAPVRLFPVRDRFRQRRALPPHCRQSSTSWARCACVLPCRSRRSGRQLEVDDVQRVVCHSLRDGYQLPVSQLPPPVSSWSTPAPSAVSQPAISAPQSVPVKPVSGGFLRK